jgi:hypothetical protein
MMSTSKQSPESAALHEAFDRHFLPLLQRLGFATQKPKNVKPGLVVAFAVRPLDEQRRLEATLWCDGGSGHNLRFRFDLVEPVQGVECSRQLDLKVPWPDPNYPNPLSLDFSGGEFLPHESPDRLKMAIAFLAGAFALNADKIAEAVPELAEALREAQSEGSWRDAAARAGDLWKNRHQRGDIDERSVAATVVFVGSNLATVDAEGVRLTFRFDTRSFNRNLPVSVSGWYSTAAGTRAAMRLKNGEITWNFDQRGQLASVEPGDRPMPGGNT